MAALFTFNEFTLVPMLFPSGNSPGPSRHLFPDTDRHNISDLMK